MGYLLASMLSGTVLGSENNTLETILVPINVEKIIPSDLGVPIKFYDRCIELLRLRIVFPKYHDRSDFEFDFHIKAVRSCSVGMKIYNPINNEWHGIQEHTTTAINIPISGAARSHGFINYKADSSMGALGIQYYAQTQVFIEDINSKAIDYVRVGKEFIPPRYVSIFS